MSEPVLVSRVVPSGAVSDRGVTRVVFTGSRTWNDMAMVEQVIDALPSHYIICHGHAKSGLDAMADHVALARRHIVERYPAQWSTFGKVAGRLRNTYMLATTLPIRVFAFWDGSSRGTKHCIDEAKRFDIPVEIFYPMDEGPIF